MPGHPVWLQEAVDLMLECLQLDPAARPTILQVLHRLSAMAADHTSRLGSRRMSSEEAARSP